MPTPANPDPWRNTLVLFGHALRDLRDDANLTQQALAGRIGTSDSTLSDLELGKGERVPTETLVIAYIDHCLKEWQVDQVMKDARRAELVGQHRLLAALRDRLRSVSRDTETEMFIGEQAKATYSADDGLFTPSTALLDKALPSMLLRPEYGVVPFLGRQGEITDLLNWATDGAAISARLVTGPAGQGKTRLALRLCELVRERGWIAGVISKYAGPDQFERVTRIQAPLLLVIDDAEERVEQVRALGRTLLDKHAMLSMPAQLLLVSTHADWLAPLRDDSGHAEADLFRRCAEHQLGPLPRERKPAEFARAGQAFASALKLSPFASHIPEPSDSRLLSIVDVHAAVLAALLDGGTTHTPVVNPMARLHRLDQAFWASDGRDLDQARLPIAIAVATIFGAKSEHSARTLLAALPDFSDTDQDTLGRYVSWLGQIYPGSGALNPIYPRQIAIRHIVAILRQHPDLISAVAGVLDDRQVEQALVTLTMAASAQHDLSDAIADLLASDPPRVLPMAVHVMKRLTSPPPPLVTAINTTITAELPAEALIDVSRELEPLGLRYLPTLQHVQKALIDKTVPPSEPDPTTAAVVDDLNRLSQNLSERLSGLFNHDVLRIIELTRRKYLE